MSSVIERVINFNSADTGVTWLSLNAKRGNLHQGSTSEAQTKANSQRKRQLRAIPQLVKQQQK
jgi:hypothetical protein